MKQEYIQEIRDYVTIYNKLDAVSVFKILDEVERYKKYVMYFAGKDKVNDIELAMRDRELD